MMRASLLAIATAGLAASAAIASAQTAPAAANVPSSCPRNTLKVYFASGDVTASPQAQALLGKIGETASSCEPDHIDLVAHFDPKADGDRAIAVALERLAVVVQDLVSRGLPTDRIRIAARAVKASDGPAGHLNQIDVLFRKAGEAAEDRDPTPPPPALILRSQAI